MFLLKIGELGCVVLAAIAIYQGRVEYSLFFLLLAIYVVNVRKAFYADCEARRDYRS